MPIEILGAESLGVRSLCCVVRTAGGCFVIDPGVALGPVRHGFKPHPLEAAYAARTRQRIGAALIEATDVVFSHFHGDHVPLRHADPYQLALHNVPANFKALRIWSKAPQGLSRESRLRARDLQDFLGEHMRWAESYQEKGLMFSAAVPHGEPDSPTGSVMMTRIELDEGVFVHTSDIQLLDNATVDALLEWHPDFVLAAGPPIYLPQLHETLRRRAWENALRLARRVKILILDHHLLRGEEGLN
jgi:predicted metallo-beta-lactamase superfamily hydrolase